MTGTTTEHRTVRADIVRSHVIDFMQLSVASHRVFAPFIGSIMEATGSKDRGVRLTYSQASTPSPVALQTCQEPECRLVGCFSKVGAGVVFTFLIPPQLLGRNATVIPRSHAREH